MTPTGARRKLIALKKCRFITPDGYNLHVIQGRLTIFDKPENDELRTDTWKYQWYGWNDTNR